MTKNTKTVLLTTILCLLPVIMSVVVYPDLPEQMAIHWNIAGEPDNFVPKAVGAFGLPLLMAVINVFSKLRFLNDPKRKENPQAMTFLAIWTPPLLSIFSVPVSLFIALGVPISMSLFGSFASLFTGVVLVLCGNYLPKIRQNYTVGIKLPWTLHDVDIWNKTHRIAGYLWMLCGMALIAGTFLFNKNGLFGVPLILFILIAGLLLPMAYAYILYKKKG